MVFWAVSVPLILLLLLIWAIWAMWRKLNMEKKQPGSTEELSKRIYSNFEFFVKIFLALVAGFGYVKLTLDSNKAELARQALIAIGAIGLVTMVTIVLSVASIQGWKLQRWDPVQWHLIATWQELYIIIAMYLLAAGLWAVAWVW